MSECRCHAAGHEGCQGTTHHGKARCDYCELWRCNYNHKSRRSLADVVVKIKVPYRERRRLAREAAERGWAYLISIGERVPDVTDSQTVI